MVNLVDGPVLDLGELRAQGTQKTGKFRIKSTSSSPLSIAVRGTTCHCTSALLSSGILYPNGEVTASVTVDWHGRAGPQHEGVDFQVTNTDTHATDYLRTDVVGVVNMPIRTSSDCIDFGVVGEGATDTHDVTIGNGALEPSIHFIGVNMLGSDGVKLLSCDLDGLPVRNFPVDGHLMTVHIGFSPHGPEVRTSASMTIVGSADGEDFSRSIPITGVMKARKFFVPACFVLRPGETGVGRTFSPDPIVSVSVIDYNGAPVRSVEVRKLSRATGQWSSFELVVLNAQRGTPREPVRYRVIGETTSGSVQTDLWVVNR